MMLALAVVCTLKIGALPHLDAAYLLGALSVNDQNRKEPLKDALANGFVGVEVEVRIEAGRLMLDGKAHSDLTFESAYLEPLKKRIGANGGRVFAGGPTFTLFLKAKKEDKAVGEALAAELAPYKDLLSADEDRYRVNRGLTVVFESTKLASEAAKPYFLEGRFSDLDLSQAKAGISYFADSWMMQVRWLGIGQINNARSQTVIDFIRKVHSMGKYVRFTGTPDNPGVWSFLVSNEVDFIGTQNLEELASFLERHPMKPRVFPPKKDGGEDRLLEILAAERATMLRGDNGDPKR